jgi:hypothetical protein
MNVEDVMDNKIPTYPVVNFLVRNGMILSILISVLPILATLYLALAGWSPLMLVVGIGAAVVVGILLASYVEVLRIIADTLMPR